MGSAVWVKEVAIKKRRPCLAESRMMNKGIQETSDINCLMQDKPAMAYTGVYEQEVIHYRRDDR